MNRLTVWLMLAVGVALVGCIKPDPDMPLKEQRQQQVPLVKENERVDVTRIGVFEDRMAYGGARAVYIIRDKQTGREYIGVSGVGISETGSHRAGKARAEDER